MVLPLSEHNERGYIDNTGASGRCEFGWNGAQSFQSEWERQQSSVLSNLLFTGGIVVYLVFSQTYPLEACFPEILSFEFFCRDMHDLDIKMENTVDCMIYLIKISVSLIRLPKLWELYLSRNLFNEENTGPYQSIRKDKGLCCIRFLFISGAGPYSRTCSWAFQNISLSGVFSQLVKRQE